MSDVLFILGRAALYLTIDTRRVSRRFAREQRGPGRSSRARRGGHPAQIYISRRGRVGLRLPTADFIIIKVNNSFVQVKESVQLTWF